MRPGRVDGEVKPIAVADASRLRFRHRPASGRRRRHARSTMVRSPSGSTSLNLVRDSRRRHAKRARRRGGCRTGTAFPAWPPRRPAPMRIWPEPRRHLAREIHAARLGRPSGDAVLSRQLALDRAEVGRGPRQHARAEREPRARDPRAAYARRALGLHAGGRDELRQGADRLDHHSGDDQSGARRRVRVQSAHARAGAADGRRQGLRAAGRRAGQGGARRYRAPSGDRRACGAQARAAFLRPTSRRMRWSSGCRGASSIPTAT